MAYDEELADRIRELLGGEPDLSERKMFGGLAFLIGDNMSVAASGQGGVLVRVDPGAVRCRSRYFERSSHGDARPPDAGWLRVAHDDVRTKRQLAKWVTLGVRYARSLPAKVD